MEPRRLHKAKRSDNGEWVIGYYYPDKSFCQDEHAIHPEELFMVDDLDDLAAQNIDLSTLCQCTGKLDVNKKIIYENDEVTLRMLHGPEPHGIVEWCEVTQRWVVENIGKLVEVLDLGEFEILGNIHD